MDVIFTRAKPTNIGYTEEELNSLNKSEEEIKEWDNQIRNKIMSLETLNEKHFEKDDEEVKHICNCKI